MDLKEVYVAMGGDYESVMTRLPKEASVIKFLKKFAGSDDYNKLIEAAERKDYPAVFAASHTLKGVCGNLSISKLAQSSSDVCEAVRGGEPTVNLDELIEVCKKDYLVTVDAISQLDE